MVSSMVYPPALGEKTLGKGNSKMVHCISMHEWRSRYDQATYISRHTHLRHVRGPAHDPSVTVDRDWLKIGGPLYHNLLIGFCTKKWILFRLAKDGEEKRPSARTVFLDGNLSKKTSVH